VLEVLTFVCNLSFQWRHLLRFRNRKLGLGIQQLAVRLQLSRSFGTSGSLSDGASFEKEMEKRLAFHLNFVLTNLDII